MPADGGGTPGDVVIPGVPPVRNERVPVRTILASIGFVLATAAVLLLVRETSQALTWMVIAMFFAVALYPVVSWVQRRLVHRRSMATLLEPVSA
jgi:predicted PurR-regulated permease PerM